MNCPYCAEPVNEGAAVCKTCRREIALAVALKASNEVLEQRVKELEAEVAKFAGLPEADSAAPVVEAPPEPLPAPPSRPGILDLLAIYVLLPTVLLIGAHYLLIVKFDAKLAWLRAASIVVPAIFGWLLERKLHAHWFVPAALGVVVALTAVFGMSTTVHFVDGDPILPKGTVAWRETLEYAASISLAYLLGALLAHATHPLKEKASGGRIAELATFVTHVLSGKNEAAKTLEEAVQRLVKWINLGIAAATGFGAVFAGFKGIL